MSMSEQGPSSVASDRIWTVPNALSVLRLLGVPLFLWLLLGPHADGWALVVLIISAATDWADGKLARLLDQYSKLGELLDPAADRLYILATLYAFVVRGILPWWAAALIVLRDVVLGLAIPVLRRHGYPPLTVHYLGKAATFCLLYAFPFLLVAQGDGWFQRIAAPVGTAFVAWGIGLYLWSGVLYLQQVIWVVRRTPVRLSWSAVLRRDRSAAGSTAAGPSASGPTAVGPPAAGPPAAGSPAADPAIAPRTPGG